jgi:hypothetical protein
VQQEKILRAERSWTNLLNAIQEAIHYSFTKFCIYCFSLWYKLFVHYALRVKKYYQHVLNAGLWNFSFFGRGAVPPTHLELCCLVLGQRQNTRSQSPITILPKKFLSALAIAIMSW